MIVMPPRVCYAALAAAQVIGCAAPPSASHSVRSATAAEVAGCRYVADVQAISEEAMLRPGSNFDRARVAGLDAAKEAGATHVVWGRSAVPSHGTAEARGVAFRCGAAIP
ncbi:hypothetical protein ABXN37_19710 [Piscinibacter sakaiensis]|uniref:hypothetical protein n=1 Tax=Piscinibacter sakaiensis TaxID=1547922 RepID=UPI0006B50330|nr:hypothetical protein [Piscinibacter sakaiensis]